MFDLELAFGLVAAVLIVAALVSRLVERSPLSFPLVFLGLGMVLSEPGLGVVQPEADSAILEAVATLTLALVLFLDALNLQVDELGKRWLVPVLILGPGTALIIALGAVPLALLMGFSWTLAFIGGAILASTDPVILREIVRDVRIPRAVRQVLKIEAGTNDLVVLPAILILIAVAQSQMSGVGAWAEFLSKLLLLGPVLGFAVGGLGAWLMGQINQRTTVRREHQALYGIGLVLAAYTAATAAGSDGLLAAFMAGVAVLLLNHWLCDCFVEYGEVTAEMAMLLTFVLFGAVIADNLDRVDIGPTIGLAALVIFVFRPVVLGVVLSRARMSWEALGFVAWFGPRGLNSLLLALLVVQAELDDAVPLLATIGVVVLASALLHGATATPLSAWYARRAM